MIHAGKRDSENTEMPPVGKGQKAVRKRQGRGSQLGLRILLCTNLAEISATERTYRASRGGGCRLLDTA